jgi:outer membrane receptor protein involved in Fe transport
MTTKGYTAVPRNSRKLDILATASAIAMIGLAGNAHAQANASGAVEEVVVTGSRIARAGFVAPTPVTAVTQEQLKATAPNDISDGLATIPAFRGASARTVDNGSGSSNGNAGASLLSLRGLGSNRTLVLLDGRRVVGSNVSGSTDTNLIPQELVRSVEVVTGGASAAYGSDAVAGVVNFKLDTGYEGVKGSVQGGVSRYNDAGSWKVSLTGGHSFGDRARIIANIDYYYRDGIDTYSDKRKWRNTVDGWITNATGVTIPARVRLTDVHYSARSYGSLIVAGPLAGTDFGPGGAPTAFQYGTVRSATFMQGGDPNGPLPFAPMGSKIDRATGFAHAEYDLTDNLTAFIEGTAANSETPYQMQYNYLAGGDVLTIFSGNPYIPASIQQRMTAGNIASFQIGRVNRDQPINYALNHSDTQRVAVGLNGKVGSDWTYNVYYTHGASHLKVFNQGAMNVHNIVASTDAVINPANGQIVCRSTLSGLDPGCVPTNWFGEGSVTENAYRYTNGTSFRNLKLKQDVAAASMQGTLGEWAKLWGDSASIAFGAEARKESAAQTSDLVSQSFINFNGLRGGPASRNGALGGFTQSNFQPVSGEVTVKEAFGELALPIAADKPFFKLLDVNAAARVTDYSTSGRVTTWKIGAVWEPGEDLRLRLTRSRDIRAPNISELFSGGTAGNGTVRDPATGILVPSLSFTRGNPDLGPETADTLTYGVVYEPSFVPGLGMSLDYYDIDITDAIATIGGQTTVDECAKGSQIACQQITIVSGTYRLNIAPLNLARVINRGFDGELSYSLPVAGGRLGLRALGNYTTVAKSTTPGAATIDRAKEAGQLQATFSANYNRGPLGLNVQTRYISDGLYNAQYIVGTDIDSNHVPKRFYTDLSVKYKFEAMGADSEVFLNVNNVFNKKPPVSNSQSTFVIETDVAKYDIIGTYATVGIRFAY